MNESKSVSKIWRIVESKSLESRKEILEIYNFIGTYSDLIFLTSIIGKGILGKSEHNGSVSGFWFGLGRNIWALEDTNNGDSLIKLEE